MKRGKTHSPETRAKMAAAARNRAPEILAKMVAAKRGKTHTPEAKAKIAAGNRGKTHTPESRAKMAEAKNPFLKGLTESQRAYFRFFRRKGYSSADARELVLTYV